MNAAHWQWELAELKWYCTGYLDYPNCTYLKSLKRSCRGINSQANLEATVTPDGIITFRPVWKKKYSPEEIECMFKLAGEFMNATSKYGTRMEWRYEKDTRDRDADIRKLRKSGATFSEIARKYDLTTSRIQQICKEETA